MTFNEFSAIISTADSSVSNQNELRMFRETLLLMPDGGDNISPEAFATVAHAHGIKAPSNVVFDLLKKTWLQVSNRLHASAELYLLNKFMFSPGLIRAMQRIIVQQWKTAITP